MKSKWILRNLFVAVLFSAMVTKFLFYVVVFCNRPPPGLKTGKDFRGQV